MKVHVNDKVRPHVELVENSGNGLEVAAMVYGRTKEEAVARAELISTFLAATGSLAYVRRRLKQITWYHHIRNAYKRTLNWPVVNWVLELALWLLGCAVEPEEVAQWLLVNFDDSDPFARIVPFSEAGGGQP